MLRPILIALLALALAPAAASAADSGAVIDIAVAPAAGAVFGEAGHTVTGKITGPYSAPLVGRSVVLEARPYPYKHRRFKAVETAKSGLDGRFALDHAFDRNQQVRVFAPEFGDRSFVLPAYVYPRTALNFGLVRRNVIRLVQTYRTPKNIRLTAPTLFYVGRKNKKRAPLVAKVKTRPVRAKGKHGKRGKIKKGRFRATAVVRLPRAWQGRFRYASCFPYNAGMGNPKLGCPKKRYKF